VEVVKQREIYFIDNVKFHLDNVPGLGSFVEIEAIDANGTVGKEKLLEQCEYYMDKLSIQKEDLISLSYSDMLLQL
jgi:predicted adenylyl cyclase CyaB